MSEGESNRKRCEAHGMVYDSSVHSGCVVCRRDSPKSLPPARSGTRSIKIKIAGVAVALIVLSVALLGLGWSRYEGWRARIEADAPTEPTVEPVVSSLPGIPSHKGTIMLGRTGTDEYGYPRDLPDKLTLLSLLREKRFEELTQHMEILQNAFEQDFRKEQWPMTALEAFSVANPELTPLLDRWVEATPESYAPYAARAQHTMGLAWHYRGGKWAALTAEKRFEKMRETLALVPADLTRALELRPRLIEAYRTMLNQANMTSAGSRAKQSIFENGIRHCPYCVGLRATYLHTMRPRWGGSLSLVEAKANDGQYPDKNPKLRVLLGFADDDRCHTLNKKEPRDALPLCDRALEHGPYGRYLLRKARVLLKLDRRAEAIQSLTEALDILPQEPDYLEVRGWALLKEGRHDEAAEDLILAARLDPANEKVQKNLTHIFRKQVRTAYDAAERGRLDEAITTYTRVTEIHPNYVDAWFYRASAYEKKGEAKLAEQDCLRVIELDPTHLDAYRLLDHVLFKQKRLDEIVQHWNRYLALRPKDADALMERSGTYYHKGEMSLAKQDVIVACALGNQRACETQKRFR